MLKESKPIAIECKWHAEEFEIRNLRAFRKIYKEGENFVVAENVKRPYLRDYEGLKVKFLPLEEMIRFLLA